MDPWTFPHTPAPPEWAVEWDALAARFTWLGALAGTPQDAAFHAEGDVLTHTRMVAEALARLDAWRALPAEERSALFAAALLHDIAKPACTRIAPDGRVTSPGHARAGALRSRELLLTRACLNATPPFAAREQIAQLVRHHGLPLWFLEKPDPERAVIAASQSVRMDHVALLAEADVRGRVCADQAELLARIALFRDFCAETQCLSGPRAFANDQSRFRYFRTPHATPDYVAWDETTFEVILLSGLPGAGKDTWARQQRPHLPVISLDAIRQELHVLPTEPQGAVIHLARDRARALLRRGEPFIWNATNLTRALRSSLIDLFASYHARIRIVYLDADFETLLQRNDTREAAVPVAVLRRMARKLEVPDLTEAHQVEWVTAVGA